MEWLMINGKVTILGDNKGALSMCTHECNHATSRHYTALMSFIRFMIETDQINVRYVATKENVADILTKPVGRQVFAYLMDQIRGLTMSQSSVHSILNITTNALRVCALEHR